MKKTIVFKSVFTLVAVFAFVAGNMNSIHAEAQGTTTYGGCNISYGSILTGRNTAHGYTAEAPLKHKVSVYIRAYGTTPNGDNFSVNAEGYGNDGEALCDAKTSQGNFSSVYGTHYVGNYIIYS